jgi:hypothetical protein
MSRSLRETGHFPVTNDRVNVIGVTVCSEGSRMLLLDRLLERTALGPGRSGVWDMISAECDQQTLALSSPKGLDSAQCQGL